MTEVLIVDDDVKIVKMLTRRLKKAGFGVHTAENGQIGVEKALELHPDLILMDMYMPVLDGYKATQALREKGYAGIIVALTASAMAHQASKSLQAGCDRFIAKPVGIDFEQQLRNILEERDGENTDRR